MASGAPPSGVERSLHFYRLYCGVDATGAPLLFDPTQALGVINSLAGPNRYGGDPAEPLIGWVHPGGPGHRIEFARVRRDAMPRIERLGTQRDLILRADEGLLDATYVVMFADGLVGAVFNFYGPRVSALPAYLRLLARAHCPDELTMRPLLRHDAADRLDQLQDVKVVELSVRDSFIDAMRDDAPDLVGALAAARDASSARSVQLVLKPERYKRNGRLRNDLLPALRRLARRPDIRDGADAFRVSGTNLTDGHLDTIDVLSDKLVSAVQLVRQSARSRALLIPHVFEVVESVYADRADELRAAPDIG